MQYGLSWWGYHPVVSFVAVLVILTCWGAFTGSRNATGLSNAIGEGKVLWILINAIRWLGLLAGC